MTRNLTVERTHQFSATLVILSIIVVNGCAAPKPVLYPNAHLKDVGQDQATRDIAECEELAEEYVSKSHAGKEIAGKTAVGAGVGAASGAVGGAIGGSAGLGAAIGAAAGATQGLLQGLIGSSSSAPSPAYRNFVNRCFKRTRIRTHWMGLTNWPALTR